MADYKLTNLDLIWNRACDSFSTATLGAGDRALRDLLRAHGPICNGGVFHVFDVLSEPQIEAAKSGYRFFDILEVAELLTRAKGLLETEDEIEEYETTIDREYWRCVHDDSHLVERFKRHYAAKPSDFAPLTPDVP